MPHICRTSPTIKPVMRLWMVQLCLLGGFGLYDFNIFNVYYIPGTVVRNVGFMEAIVSTEPDAVTSDVSFRVSVSRLP